MTTAALSADDVAPTLAAPDRPTATLATVRAASTATTDTSPSPGGPAVGPTRPTGLPVRLSRAAAPTPVVDVRPGAAGGQALLGHVPTALLRAAPTTRPDPATAAVVHRLTGTPVAATPVRRGAAVEAAARALGAAAFTSDGVVHLPDRHGPTTTPEARTLLAHELTHVAQHVRATLDPAHRPQVPPYEHEHAEAEAREVARRMSRDDRPERREPPARADTSQVRRSTASPPPAPADDDVPDDATLDRQARLLYPRVRALLDADLARERRRAGGHPARR